jgi:hypothetical protein
LEVHSEISYSLFFWNGKSKLYPGSIELSISETYGGLVGGHMNLAYMPLGSEATKDAVSVLARYDPRTTTDRTLGLAAATIWLTFCESLRIKPTQLVISRGWDNAGPVYIVPANARLTVPRLGAGLTSRNSLCRGGSNSVFF